VRLAPDKHGGIAVSVEDDGVGVPPGAEGRRVGLRVARRLVERIGGSLSLRSEPGRTIWSTALPGTARRRAGSACMPSEPTAVLIHP
jgi:signal transduction histidine kinase